MFLNSVVTISDWAFSFGVWGEAGVMYILQKCKDNGIRRIYWRVRNGGLAIYPSQIAEVQYKGTLKMNYPSGHPLNYQDFRTWDPLKTATGIAHELGLELYAWFSFEEEAHCPAFQSKFDHEHPQYRKLNRKGLSAPGCLSFAYPDVVEYKLSLLKEVVAYPIDGLFLDFVRVSGEEVLEDGKLRSGNDIQDENGISLWGYEKPIVEAYQKKYGTDPKDIPNSDEKWVKFRAGYMTEFVKKVRSLTQEKKLPVRAMVYKNNALKGWLHDWKTWVNERTIDAIIPFITYPSGSPDFQKTLDIRKHRTYKMRKGRGLWDCEYLPNPQDIYDYPCQFRKEAEAKCEVGVGFGVYRMEPDELKKALTMAEKAKVDEVILWETPSLESEMGGLTQGRRGSLWEVVRCF